MECTNSPPQPSPAIPGESSEASVGIATLGGVERTGGDLGYLPKGRSRDRPELAIRIGTNGRLKSLDCPADASVDREVENQELQPAREGRKAIPIISLIDRNGFVAGQSLDVDLRVCPLA